MSNAKDIGLTNVKLNVLVYGKSGTGKTPFACFFPKPYVFDFDKGMMSVRGRDVDYDTYKSFPDFKIRLMELEGKCVYETLVLDSLTTMEEYCMDSILQANRRAMPTMNEWNVLIAEMKDTLMRLTKTAKHCVVVAHEQMIQDEITGEILIRPQVVGKKLPAQIPLWFDEVYRTQVTRTKEGIPTYSIMTVADTKFTAKSRIHCLPTIMDWSEKGEMVNPYELITGLMGKGGK